MSFFWGKMSIFRVKMTFFSHRPAFTIFPFFSQIFRIFTMLNVVYDPFLTRKTPFLLYSYFHTHSTTLYFSKYWGDQCMGRPHLKFWGDRPPSPPRSPPLSDTYWR